MKYKNFKKQSYILNENDEELKDEFNQRTKKEKKVNKIVTDFYILNSENFFNRYNRNLTPIQIYVINKYENKFFKIIRNVIQNLSKFEKKKKSCIKKNKSRIYVGSFDLKKAKIADTNAMKLKSGNTIYVKKYFEDLTSTVSDIFERCKEDSDCDNIVQNKFKDDTLIFDITFYNEYNNFTYIDINGIKQTERYLSPVEVNVILTWNIRQNNYYYNDGKYIIE